MVGAGSTNCVKQIVRTLQKLRDLHMRYRCSKSIFNMLALPLSQSAFVCLIVPGLLAVYATIHKFTSLR